MTAILCDFQCTAPVTALYKCIHKTFIVNFNWFQLYGAFQLLLYRFEPIFNQCCFFLCNKWDALCVVQKLSTSYKKVKIVNGTNKKLHSMLLPILH